MVNWSKQVWWLQNLDSLAPLNCTTIKRNVLISEIMCICLRLKKEKQNNHFEHKERAKLLKWRELLMEWLSLSLSLSACVSTRNAHMHTTFAPFKLNQRKRNAIFFMLLRLLLARCISLNDRPANSIGYLNN